MLVFSPPVPRICNPVGTASAPAFRALGDIVPFWVILLSLTAAAAAAAKSLQSCPTLCDPLDSSPPGSPIPRILQARILEWVAISFSNKWKWKVKVKLLSHAWLSDLMDCSLPGSSVHGIFQARVLEWGAIAFSICPSLANHNLSRNKKLWMPLLY